MKKKTDSKPSSESCYMMNNLKTGIDGKTNAKDINDETDQSLLQNFLTSVKAEPLSTEVKREEDSSLNDNSNSEDQSSLVNLGPGAEIKGKLCHPVPSVSKTEKNCIDQVEDGSSPPPSGDYGGRLTFFREGRPLLELSHRSDQRSWIQVKSKTYWPPPSTATTTTTQHPLRHDTPTTHSASDDCSSLNSSPWSSDHIRKQNSPRAWRFNHSEIELFYLKSSPFTRGIRKKVRLRRNPCKFNLWPCVEVFDLSASNKQAIIKNIKPIARKNKLEDQIRVLGEKFGWKPKDNTNIRSLFEKALNHCSEVFDPTFLSPRKRYLRNLETDLDSHIRKKVHAGLSPSLTRNCDRPSSSSPSLHVSHKSAISSHNSSYSIDSLLGHEADSKKSDSYLRTLLKPDSRHRSSHGRARDRTPDYSNHVKNEKESAPLSRERRETSADQRKTISDHFELKPADLSRYASSPGLSGFYLNPYFDPRYMMLHTLSGAAPLLPAVSQHNDVAVAVAAAAAASYPLNPLQLSALTASSLLPHGIPSPYVPNTSLASQLLQSPSSNRSSPISLPQSPVSKPSVVPPPIPVSPHLRVLGSPHSPSWTPLVNSPHKFPREPPDSSPPQDVPLNLTKPKEES